MTSFILSLKTVISINPKSPSPRRRFCHASSASPPPHLQFHLQHLGRSLLPSVAVLESHFSNQNIHHPPHLGTGFFINPTQIVTSTHVVGRILHNARIARTTAFTHEGVVLNTRPLALSFARDVAVLEVEAAPPPPRGCKIAESPAEKNSILLAISRHQSLGLAMMVGNVRGAAGQRSVGAKAPWPLDDELGWIEHGWLGFGIGDPASGGMDLSYSVATRIAGSPWFNLEGEVVGVSSWEARDEGGELSVGFAAPVSSIGAVVDYAKTKGPDDPIVMDPWIGAYAII